MKKCGQKEEKNSELLKIYYTPGLLLGRLGVPLYTE